MSKKTLVLGASLKPERYSNIATKRLTKHGHEVALVGLREGQVEGIDIQNGTPEVEGLITIIFCPFNQSELSLTLGQKIQS